MKILLVDKHDCVHNFVDIVLSKIDSSNVSVIHADSPGQAIQKYNENKGALDLILMGTCGSGTVNTVNVTKKIRESFEGDMIAVSSFKDLAKELIEAGCNSAIYNKPKGIPKVIKERISVQN